MNIETQCEIIDVEDQDSVGPYLRELFCLDVRTSDPLLNVVKWIAFFTWVPCFDMRDVIVTCFLTQIGLIAIVVLLTILSMTSEFAGVHILCTVWCSSL